MKARQWMAVAMAAAAAAALVARADTNAPAGGHDTAAKAWKAFATAQRAQWQVFTGEVRKEREAAQAEAGQLPAAQRDAALNAFREKEAPRVEAFTATMHAAQVAFLNERLAQHAPLTDAERSELITCFEALQQQHAALRLQRHGPAEAYVEQVAQDASLTQAQRKAKIEAYLEQGAGGTKTRRPAAHASRGTPVRAARGGEAPDAGAETEAPSTM